MKNLKQNTVAKASYLSMLTIGVFILTSAFAPDAQSQTAFKFSDGSRITVNGTSNLHAWTMTTGNFTSEASLELKGQQLQNISVLSFSLPVINLKSKEELLNTRAYKALKAQQYSRVTFRLTNATVISSQRTIRATGNLTIAGKTNLITIESNYIQNGDEITIKGSKSLKMSDYDIKAPSFMLGALKTGNEVIIDINLKLKKSTITALNNKETKS
jgi:polyisoprenoid-binding protein YceI